MGYTLTPKKKIASINVGAFSWPMFLQETGAGYVIGYGAGRAPATYVYQSNNHGSPVSNDGYKVTAAEAKAMAMCMRGYISVASFINKEWEEKFPDENERKIAKETPMIGSSKLLYNVPMAKERLEQLAKIAEFIENSGGFKIT